MVSESRYKLLRTDDPAVPTSDLCPFGEINLATVYDPNLALFRIEKGTIMMYIYSACR